jgi:hypothetical protein
MFSGCVKLQLHATIFCAAGEEATRFAGQTVNFNSCFIRTSFTGLQGIAPDLWNYTMVSSLHTTTFGGVGNSLTSLSNYALVPVGWK